MSDIPRRSMAALLPALLAGARPAAAADRLPAQMVNADEVELRKRPSGTTGRSFFEGMTHENFRVELHETRLDAGKAPHAPHRHANEEVIIIHQGKVRAEIEGEEPKEVTAGGAIYVASNKMHSWTNTGDVTAIYYVVEIGNNR